MLSRIDQPEKEDAVERLRALIADRKHMPGDRLPPERQLIELLGVGRSALRRALEHLERDGVIWRHVGKGTFVSHGMGGSGDALSELAHQMNPVRMMRARLCIEPAIAREAAVNASGEAIAKINVAMERAQAAVSWSEYERQDDLFHRAVVEASDNVLLVALFDSLNRVQREVAWGSVERDTSRPPEQHSSFGEHEAIAEAIAAHDPEGAFRAMGVHLKSVSTRLFGDS
ncbi:MAG: FadR family transcriptional regulator [Litoreibacter sp.]|nr:FadR family transcriptional regulator [Litoreibacter sp.]